MNTLIEELRDLKLAIFDLDGVVYRGKALISDVDKVIKTLKEISVQVVYNSNNSTATRKMYVERLNKMNIASEENDFYTSASITSSEITKLKQDSNIFIIGEIGLQKELEAKGHHIITDEQRYEEVDFVIVGLDRHFTYEKLAIAQRCILEGHAQFYATNADSTLPAATRILPGAGVMVNALRTCTSQEPIKIFGKPSPFGINLILEERNINPEYAGIFGDRLNTDILAGNRAGIKTIAVLTGITSEEEITRVKERTARSPDQASLIPNLVFSSLKDIFY